MRIKLRNDSLFVIGLGITFILVGVLVLPVAASCWIVSGSFIIILGLVHEWAMRDEGK